MRASNSWTKRRNAGRKEIEVRERSVGWVGMDGVSVVLLSHGGETFKLEMNTDEAEALAGLLEKHVRQIRDSASYKAWKQAAVSESHEVAAANRMAR